MDEFHKAGEIVDIIVSFDIKVPNVFEVPTFLVLDSNPSSFAEQRILVRNILTYDGYLTDSPEVEKVLQDLLFSARKSANTIHKFSKFFHWSADQENIANPKIKILSNLFDLSDRSFPSRNITKLSQTGRITVFLSLLSDKKVLEAIIHSSAARRFSVECTNLFLVKSIGCQT